MEKYSIVYMVAGLSSRFNGKIKKFEKITDNETLIEYSINQALEAGFSKIIFIVGEKTETPFKEKFKNEYKKVPVFYAFQSFDKNTRDKPWGTVDALCSTRDIINESFVVCNVDDIYGKEAFKTLINHLKTENINVSLGYKLENVLPETGEVNRAIFEIDSEKVKSIKEIFNVSKYNLSEKGLTKNSLCSMNIFGLTKKTLELLCKNLDKFKEENKYNRKIECLLPNEISRLIEQNKIKMKIYKTNEPWYGITNPGDEIKIREIIKNKK